MDNTEQTMTLRELSETLEMDRSHARKWIIDQGYTFHKVRDPSTGNQQVAALSGKDASEVIALRERGGYLSCGGGDTPALAKAGVFYAVQLVPELDPRRVKLGYATSIRERMATYRTVCPNAAVLLTRPCKPTWERAATDAATASEDCASIGTEVYEVEDLDALVGRCEAFFNLMPSGGEEVIDRTA